MNNLKLNQYEKMTQTPVERLVLSLSVPTIISMMVSNFYNLVDTAFVGTLGNSASGAVGIVFGFMAILQAIGFLFGQGSGSIISRKLGARKPEEAGVTASTGFFFAFVISVIAAVLCYVFLDSIIYFLGSTETIAPFARTYILFILVTSPFQVTTFTLNNILRYEGKAFYGMIGLMSGAFLNIFGDALFMFVFHMGIAGAGLSTAISQLVSFIILLVPFFRGRTQCRLSIKNVKYDWKIVWNIVATGSPSLVRQGLNSVSSILLNFMAKPYGDEAIAAMSIVSRIFFFMFSISVGIGQGFQPVCGFNYGAGKFRRLRKAFNFTFMFSEIMMLIIGAVIFVVSPQLVKLFRNDEAVINIASYALRFQCVSLVFLPVAMVTEMLFQSSGNRFQAVVLSACRSGLIFIPLLLLLAHVQGLKGIQTAQAYSFMISAIPAVIMAVLFFKKLPPEDSSDSVSGNGGTRSVCEAPNVEEPGTAGLERSGR